MADFSLNTAYYGLFIVMLLLYYVSDNLNLNMKPKCKSLYINGLIFAIYLCFYKNAYIFVVFLMYSILQIILSRIFVNIAQSRENSYYIQVSNLRNSIKLLLDSFCIVAGGVLSVWLVKFPLKNEKKGLIIYLLIFLAIYIYRNVSEKSWRYTNTLDILDIIGINVATSLIFGGYLLITHNKIHFPIATLLTMPIFAISFQLFGRLLFRIRKSYFKDHINKKEKKTALIYGAGEAGVILAREAFNNQKFPYDVVGFIDDDPRKLNTEIYKLKVIGTMSTLPEILKIYEVDELLLALPTIKGKEIRKIVEQINGIENIGIKTIPTISEILQDRTLATQLRDVRVEDLLGRDEIDINDKELVKNIEDKTVIVSGGAGSIGSELCRQLAKYNPKKIVAIDINENDIYFLELELKNRYKNLDFVSEIASVRDREKIELLFKKYKPQIVFHAAAHKHVPLMEHNPEEAIKNNIFGTKNMAEISSKYGVDRFVLISTDKAVNPANIMGATKRACELIIENMNKKSKTKFMAVRFGNVLGSHGSVIPIFENLLKQNKNLTVTHKDITRYFMTIPEAAGLVIEAGIMGNGGEIFILDMGEPVKIYDLARTMIELSNANVDIEIVGLRPGEKLYEELLYDTKTATKTESKKIFITNVGSDNDITKYYDKLDEIIKKPNVHDIKKLMKEIVISYKEVNGSV